MSKPEGFDLGMLYGAEQMQAALAAANEHADRLADSLALMRARIAKGDAGLALLGRVDALLAEHEARQGAGTEPVTSDPVAGAGRTAAQPDPLRAVAEIAARIALERYGDPMADTLLYEGNGPASKACADAALKEYADGKRV